MAKGKDVKVDLDFSLGGLFKGFENLIDLASKLKESGGEIKKEGEIDLSHLKEGMKGVFGVSVRTLVGGKPVIEPFGNIKKTPQGPAVDEEREPIADIFDEKDEIRVYAEMPGVAEEGVSADLKGDILEIKGVSKERKYRKEVLLPAKVKPDTLTSSYKNGVLEVRVKKQ